MGETIWHKVADDEKDIPMQANDMAVIEVNGKKISLARHLNQWFAFAYTCPHAGRVLTEGWIDQKGGIVCPAHKFRFDPGNGRNTSGEGYFLKRWPVEKRDDGIFIGFEAG